MNNMIMIIISVIMSYISVIMSYISFVVFALALLADILSLTQLEEILLKLAFACLFISIILIIFI